LILSTPCGAEAREYASLQFAEEMEYEIIKKPLLKVTPITSWERTKSYYYNLLSTLVREEPVPLKFLILGGNATSFHLLSFFQTSVCQKKVGRLVQTGEITKRGGKQLNLFLLCWHVVCAYGGIFRG
jgi:hypothetical protein